MTATAPTLSSRSPRPGRRSRPSPRTCWPAISRPRTRRPSATAGPRPTGCTRSWWNWCRKRPSEKNVAPMKAQPMFVLSGLTPLWKGCFYGIDPAYLACPASGRCPAHVGLQPQVGPRAQWRAGFRVAGGRDSAASECDPARVLKAAAFADLPRVECRLLEPQRSEPMSPPRIVAIALLVIGVVLLVIGMNATHSFADQMSNFFTGKWTDATMWYIIGGIALVVVGAGLTAVGMRG